MTLEEHASCLGRLVGNLQSLEFLLRALLYKRAEPPHDPLPAGTSLSTLKIGDKVGVNALTDYDSLGSLIDRYNQAVSESNPDLQVDRSVVELRDAIAHGRVSGTAPSSDGLTLVKFDRPAAGMTTLVYSELLTAEWLKGEAFRVFAEMQKVVKAIGGSFTGEA